MTSARTGSPAPLAVSDPTAALAACRNAFIGVGVMSGLINVLYLTGSFFMLEVYDRVIPSRSVPTLVGLGVLALGLFTFQGILDLIRVRILVRIAGAVDKALSRGMFESLVLLPLRLRIGGDGLQLLRDIDQVRTFMAGSGPNAFFDLPWMPLYLWICFLFHPWIGFVALGGAVFLIGLMVATDIMTRAPTRDAVNAVMARNGLAEASRRNGESLQAMGMMPQFAARWDAANGAYLRNQQRAADVSGGFGAVSKVARMVLQSAVLAVGAYLVINQEATAGIIIASSILTSRALAPVELVIANWKAFIGARQSWRRLKEGLAAVPRDSAPMLLRPPQRSLAVEAVSAAPPGTQRVVVNDVIFSLKAGEGLGIIGPSASGKSSLARLICGIWRPVRGKVRLDGAALEQYAPADLGRHIGYVPQDVELFAGTVAQNIARFEAEPDAGAIIAAAEAACVHGLVLRLAEGYETQIGDRGCALSAGQRQRIALARALYRDPFLVVLDEPNSNLDGEGEQALTHAIRGVRSRGGIVIVVAHRPSALAGVDQLLILAEGRVQAFGPRDDVLARVLNRDGEGRTIAPAPQPEGATHLSIVRER